MVKLLLLLIVTNVPSLKKKFHILMTLIHFFEGNWIMCNGDFYQTFVDIFQLETGEGKNTRALSRS